MKNHSVTDVGVLRDENQDAMYTSDLPVGRLSNLFLVADGMGGHNAGEYASNSAIEVIVESVTDSNEQEINRILEEAIQEANKRIYSEGTQNSDLKGMGTTIVAATIQDGMVYVANVGDSRLYLVSQGEIRQITKDHSLVEEMIRMGEIDRSRAKEHPDKNVITRAVGVGSELKIDFYAEQIKEKEMVLLCTDGLTNMVDDFEIKTIVNSGRDVVERVEKLVETANRNGGKDNITVAIIEP